MLIKKVSLTGCTALLNLACVLLYLPANPSLCHVFEILSKNTDADFPCHDSQLAIDGQPVQVGRESQSEKKCLALLHQSKTRNNLCLNECANRLLTKRGITKYRESFSPPFSTMDCVSIRGPETTMSLKRERDSHDYFFLFFFLFIPL
ncbi:hypothetical protein BY458DRAFT_487275 [Sporodiniella umbellata]|nr:hypothetical protein BY458DRAFT_487275 [Sporodiniella umbellata]